MNKKDLVNIFRELGATNPEGWAESQVAEGTPQLARFLFLKGCWDNIVKDGDIGWIDRQIQSTPDDSKTPFSGVAHALRRLLESGAKPEDITELVRGMQAEFLFSICHQLDDPDSVEGNEYVNWGLCQLDENDRLIDFIDGLHESVLGTDPTGREMCPE